MTTDELVARLEQALDDRRMAEADRRQQAVHVTLDRRMAERRTPAR